MWVGNLMLVILNLPLVGIWVRLLSVKQRYMFPAILVFSMLGIYSAGNSAFDLYTLTFFGILGYALTKLECEPAPLLLGFVLGPMLEEYLRRAMMISNGSPSIFFSRPISAGLLAAAAIVLVIVLLPTIRKRRTEVFEEG